MYKYKYIYILILTVFLFTKAIARDYIHIVGSTAVFPFVSLISEEFARTKRVNTPIVESTGTSAGFKLFCMGKGDQTPDIVIASRKVNSTELELCKINGIDAQDILELKLGDDSIVIASSKEFPKIDFTKDDIFNALAYYVPQGSFGLVKNPYVNWNQIHQNLPNAKIKVYGPLKNTGTFDAIVNTIFLDQCLYKSAYKINYDNKELHKICSLIRDDGMYIEASSDENIVIQKIIKNNDAFGLFSYSFFSRNASKVEAHQINGVEPNDKTIRNNEYPLSRPIFLYVKKPHIQNMKMIKNLLEEAFSDNAIGPYGYLTSIGLVSVDEKTLGEIRKTIIALD